MTPSSALAGAARQTFLPHALPSIGEDEIAEVIDSRRSGWITMEPNVKRFQAAAALPGDDRRGRSSVCRAVRAIVEQKRR